MPDPAPADAPGTIFTRKEVEQILITALDQAYGWDIGPRNRRVAELLDRFTAVEPDPEWREQIRALCGGDDLGAMIAWLMTNGWEWGIRYGKIWLFSAWVHLDELHGDCTEASDTAEALAKAILAAHTATGEV